MLHCKLRFQQFEIIDPQELGNWPNTKPQQSVAKHESLTFMGFLPDR